MTKDFGMAFEGRRHMHLVRGISLQYFILRDQALRTFCQENLVAKFEGRSNFSALDQIGMGFENRIDLLGVGNLLAIENTAARLINHLASQITIMLDLLSVFRHWLGQQTHLYRASWRSSQAPCAHHPPPLPQW